MDADVVIVGAGAAGLSAGIELAKARRRVLVVEREGFGGRAMNVEWIMDEAGGRAPGHELASALVREAEQAGVRMELGEVAEIESYSGCKSVACSDGTTYTASAVILAGGLAGKELGIPGEAEFRGKGLIHCAVCDAGLYSDQTLAVCGGGEAGLVEGLYLAKSASRVILIEAQPQLSARAVLKDQARANPKLEIRCAHKPVRIIGREFVSAIEVEEIATGNRQTLDVSGVLVHVGFEPATGYLANVVRLDAQGYIQVNERLETSTPGLLAAGDLRGRSPRRFAAAVADGKAAAAGALRFLELA